MKLYPVTQVKVVELDQMHDAVATAEPGIYQCEGITLPENTGETDVIYTLEVYTNNTATGLTTKVTVWCVANQYYEALSITSDPTSTPAAGGPVVLTIRFKLTDDPSVVCTCLDEGLDGGKF